MGLRTDTVRDTIEVEVRVVPKMKYTLLLPLNYNDGSEVPKAILDGMCQEIMLLAGGYSLPGNVTGAYRMKDGSNQMDRSMMVWVGIDESDEGELRRIVGRFAHQLNQEVLYFERTGGTIEFIPPLLPEDDQ